MARIRPERRPYLSTKIAFEQARKVARRDHAKPCDCHYCVTAERLAALMAERIRLERLLAGEPPF